MRHTACTYSLLFQEPTLQRETRAEVTVVIVERDQQATPRE